MLFENTNFISLIRNCKYLYCVKYISLSWYTTKVECAIDVGLVLYAVLWLHDVLKSIKTR